VERQRFRVRQQSEAGNPVLIYLLRRKRGLALVAGAHWLGISARRMVDFNESGPQCLAASAVPADCIFIRPNRAPAQDPQLYSPPCQD
jgi:hypothetical protein